MAEGTSTFEGLSLPRLGEYEQVQQDPTLDIVTLTGSTGQTGDFWVAQDSDGTEMFSINSAGNVAFALAATTVLAAMTVSVSSTGEISQGAENVNAFLVQSSSKSVTNGAFAYHSGGAAEAEVSTCIAMLATYGSKAPTYLVSVASTGGSLKGAAADNGFFQAATTLRTTAAISSDTEWVCLNVMNGSVAYNILSYPATGME